MVLLLQFKSSLLINLGSTELMTSATGATMGNLKGT